MPTAHKTISVLPGFAALTAGCAYLIAVLGAEKQYAIIGLIALGILAILGAAVLKLFRPVARSASEHETLFGIGAIAALIVIAGVFREDHFVLLLIVTVMLYVVAT